MHDTEPRFVVASAILPQYADWLYRLPHNVVKRLGLHRPKFLARLAANATGQPYRKTKGQQKAMQRWQERKIASIPTLYPTSV